MSKSITYSKQEKLSTSPNAQAKVDSKASFERQQPDPIQIKLPSAPNLNITAEALSLLATGLTLATVSIWAIAPFNNGFRGTFKLGSQIARYTQETFGDLGYAPKVGDKVNGYAVTSGYGKRKAPCKGCSTQHNGIDIATHKGTQLYAPHRAGGVAIMGHTVQVNCRQPSETGGGGLVAEVLIPERQVIYQMLHLEACQAGSPNGGTVIGTSGDSGLGTGPHVDLRKARTDAKNFSELTRPLEYEPVTMYEAIWVLTGKPPKAKLPK